MSVSYPRQNSIASTESLDGILGPDFYSFLCIITHFISFHLIYDSQAVLDRSHPSHIPNINNPHPSPKMLPPTLLSALLATATLTHARTPPGFEPATTIDLIVDYNGTIPLNGIEVPRNSNPPPIHLPTPSKLTPP